MYWFWFWLVMIVLDAAWWVVAMRLTKRRLWRVVVSLFMAGQIAAVFSEKIYGVAWSLYVPKFLLVAVLVWHRFVLPFALAVLVVLGIVHACAWIARRKPRVTEPGRSRPVAIDPPLATSVTRREFIGAWAALAPPLFTIGSTAVALAQLNHFRVRRFTLSIPALPRGLDGITIAQVSDMHVGSLTCGRVLREMVHKTNELRADLVLLTGDLVHDHLTHLPDAIALVKAMEGRYGLWMIEGNHDLFENGDEFDRRVKAAGIPLLLDESAVANVRGCPVQFLGLRWRGEAKGEDQERDRFIALQMRQMMKQRQPDAFPILLAHHPHAFDAAVKEDLPLTLSGHTHGGQWMFDSRRGVGPVLFRYWSGLYTRKRSQMIVSNGVGNVFPIRINAPAEIVHITLRCGVTHG